MRYPRRNIGALSFEVAPGLFEDDEAPAGAIAAFAAASPATLRIFETDLGRANSLTEFLNELVPGAKFRPVAANGRWERWPGLAAEKRGDISLAHFAFESRGTIYHGVIEMPGDLWADYFPYFEHVLLTFDIGETPQPSVPIEFGGAVPEVGAAAPAPDPAEEHYAAVRAAGEKARAMIENGSFDEAERLVLSLDRDAPGGAALANAYEGALENDPGNAALYEKALYWARRMTPEPHTALEAEQFHNELAAREARLQSLCNGARQH